MFIRSHPLISFQSSLDVCSLNTFISKHGRQYQSRDPYDRHGKQSVVDKIIDTVYGTGGRFLCRLLDDEDLFVLLRPDVAHSITLSLKTKTQSAVFVGLPKQSLSEPNPLILPNTTVLPNKTYNPSSINTIISHPNEKLPSCRDLCHECHQL